MLSNLQTSDLLILGAAIALIVLAVVLYVVSKKKKPKSAFQKRQKQKIYVNMYQFFLSDKYISKLTKRYCISLTERLNELSVYNKEEVQVGVAKFTIKLFWSVILAFSVSCFLFNDFVSVLLCAIGAYVYVQTSIERSIEATTLRIYRQLKNAISSLRIEYIKNGSDVIVALENGKYGNRIAPIMANIKQVLTSSNPEESLEEFYEKIPFKQIQTLAMVCYNINNTGDELDKYNNSTFDEALLVMNSDINSKIEQLNYEKMKFGKVENMAFVGIVGTVALRYLVSYIMPSAAILFNSMAGFLIQNACLLVSIYSYYSVAHAHIHDIMSQDDRNGMVKRIMQHAKVRKFVKVMTPDSRKRRINELYLKLSFSKKTIQDFYCEKFLYATIAFVFVIILVLSSPMIEKKFVKNYTDTFDMFSDNSAYEDDDGNTIYTKADILDMDNYYIAARKLGQWEDQDDDDLEEIEEFVTDRMPTLTSVELDEQTERLETKYQKLKNVSFKWYMVFLAYALAAIAYMLPDRSLKARLKVAKEEEEEEFLQLQVVMMILASMNFDTMDTLGHLAQIANIHKETLLYCYYGYASNPIAELDKMIDKTQSENFKQFISKIKETVEDLSIKEAFADLKNDREHICNERNDYIKENIDRRRKGVSFLAMLPMNMAIFGMLVFPLVYTGMTGLMSAMDQISAI